MHDYTYCSIVMRLDELAKLIPSFSNKARSVGFFFLFLIDEADVTVDFRSKAKI
jgi:hypothetical protein